MSQEIMTSVLSKNRICDVAGTINGAQMGYGEAATASVSRGDAGHRTSYLSAGILSVELQSKTEKTIDTIFSEIETALLTKITEKLTPMISNYEKTRDADLKQEIAKELGWEVLACAERYAPKETKIRLLPHPGVPSISVVLRMSDAIVGAVFGSTPHFASMAGTVYRITPESSGLLETYYQNIHDDLTVIIPTSSAGVSHDLSTYWTSDNVRGISASTDPSTMAEHLLLALPEERTKSLPITISCVHFPNAGDSVPMNVLKKALESAGINDDQLSDNDILAFVSMAQSVSLTEGQFLNGPGGKLQQPLIVLLLKGTLASEMDRIWPAGSLLVTDPAFFDGSASSNVAPLFATEPTEALVMKKQWFEAAFKPGRDLPYRVMLALVQKMVVTLSRSGAIT